VLFISLTDPFAPFLPVFIFSDIVQIFKRNVRKILSHFGHCVRKILLSWHIMFNTAAMFNKIFCAKLTIVTMRHLLQRVCHTRVLLQC